MLIRLERLRWLLARTNTQPHLLLGSLDWHSKIYNHTHGYWWFSGRWCAISLFLSCRWPLLSGVECAVTVSSSVSSPLLFTRPPPGLTPQKFASRSLIGGGGPVQFCSALLPHCRHTSRLLKCGLNQIASTQLQSFKIWLLHFCNSQWDPDLDLLGSENIRISGAESRSERKIGSWSRIQSKNNIGSNIFSDPDLAPLKQKFQIPTDPNLDTA